MLNAKRKIYFQKKIPVFYIIIITLLSCSQKHIPNNVDYNFKSSKGVPDYSSLNYWASHPWKTDPADNIPSPIKDKNKYS